ncbi:xanthine dehydrogenase family protein molybdopterin-binding subunit [Fulvivirga sedimenti]|uniref:Molybdopterin-dependent oxidoreductase n=1 Tax=Fulvivirga sedimenti TaxID=2879465 RepID=A0A9X1HRL6_9BACT|nr:molybdopterin cofactor-binding domain-containing protein [Fulvivirga sedimenti]MCA6074763.1 molybdopterin-dependent oxidoreductase [Fulvivirga sedimenti]MCA6075940.1 molybdopterin-dependent oxidoreductase [Fulvivirga sedimenti]MCA6077068.1 molybdopterin-dependent oxidoreductase [Fulvivirga sedimenti]
MTLVKTKIGRRSFLKGSALAGGGLMISFSWLASCARVTDEAAKPEEWFDINAFLKIGSNGTVTIISPNPEGGQNVKTSMPMIVAEELDVAWEDVIVEQAPLNTELYSRQFIGGSQAIRRGWPGLRMAGASARFMLRKAASEQWKVPVEEVTTNAGMLHHGNSGKSGSYGEMAALAAEITVPEEVELKSMEDFRIIGRSQKNVDGKKIVTGQPLFGMDYYREGMLYAMIVHPPAFGLKIASIDDSAVKSMPGIRDVFTIKVLEDDFRREYFDTLSFPEVAVIVGNSTWEVMNAKKELKIECEPIESREEKRSRFGSEYAQFVPSGLESSEEHLRQMKELSDKPANLRRKDGDPEAAFRGAANVIERSYTAPFLAHNCMEPMNFFADVTPERAELAGPLQKPELTELTLSERIGLPVEKINIEMTRLGGGYGRRSYAHWLIEAAIISQKMNAPVKLIYTREDDMTSGIYRPAYYGKFRAAFDENRNMVAYHVNIGGIPQSPLSPDRFPAGAVEHYFAEDWTIGSNITVGSFRAPHSNFMAASEQSFLDEVAEAAGKDPIDFRLELLDYAIRNPVEDQTNDYDPERYAGVLKLVREKSDWDNSNVPKGVSAYFCHNSYAALVFEMTEKNGKPAVDRVVCAVDCGIVVNPDAASNLVEGAIVDAIGNALYGSLEFKEGVPSKKNFDTYRMIRMSEAPRKIEVYFVENNIDPTGLGEPAFPPAFAALANALYQSMGKRFYKQPYVI